MATKYVRETKAARSIGAWIVLNKRGEQVATVQASYGVGRTWVNVWGRTGLDYVGRASGYGYDRLTAALDGAVVDGIRLYDHCRSDALTQRLLKRQPAEAVARDQYWDRMQSRHGVRPANAWQSCYYAPGLDRLQLMGYRVLKAI